jgi:uncharacterized membrane-anchored protein
VNQQLIIVSLLSMNMAGYALQIIKHFVYSPLRNLSMKTTTMQQLLANSLIIKTQIGPLMARPYEIIHITNLDIQEEIKPDR